MPTHYSFTKCTSCNNHKILECTNCDFLNVSMIITQFLLKGTKRELFIFSLQFPLNDSNLKLQETLHKHELHKISSDDSIKNLESAPFVSNATEYTHEETELNPKGSLFTNWPLMSSIIVYCVFSLHDMAYSEVRYIISLSKIMAAPFF